MRKRLAIVLAVVLMLTVVAAAPVSADKELRGWMEIELNAVGFGNADTPCPQVSWVGTVDFGDAVYDISFGPMSPFVFYGDKAFFDGWWAIHPAGHLEIVDGVVTECDAPVLMSGYERGDAILGVVAKAEGWVNYVNPAGPFDESLLIRPSSWSGTYGAVPTLFSGPWQVR